MERESLYAAICAAPRDDLPKLAFADWLDENGDAADRAHAELIRLQCDWESKQWEYERALEPYRIDENGELRIDAAKLAKVDPVAGRAQALLLRAEELRIATQSRPVVPVPSVNGAKFRHASPMRGIKDEVRIIATPAWYGHWQEWSSAVPVRHLVLDAQPNRNVDTSHAGQIEAAILPHIETLSSTRESVSRLFCDVIASPHLRGLRRLAPRHSPFQSGLLEALADAEHIEGLEDLDLTLSGSLSLFSMRPERFRALRRLSLNAARIVNSLAPTVVEIADAANRNLEELVLKGIGHGDGFARLAAGAADLFPRLVHLELSGSSVMGRNASDLLISAALPCLHRLDLKGNYLDGFVGRSLEKAESFPPLRSLGLGDCQLTPDGLGALTRWPGFGNLIRLDLSDNPLNHRGVAALGFAGGAKLRTLELAGCRLHDSHIQELARSRFVRSLWNWNLQNNPIEDAGYQAILASPFLSELRNLTIDRPENKVLDAELLARFGTGYKPVDVRRL